MHWLVWQCKEDTAVYHNRLQLFGGVSLDTHTKILQTTTNKRLSNIPKCLLFLLELQKSLNYFPRNYADLNPYLHPSPTSLHHM